MILQSDEKVIAVLSGCILKLHIFTMKSIIYEIGDSQYIQTVNINCLEMPCI
jgi:hypothetical protein